MNVQLRQRRRANTEDAISLRDILDTFLHHWLWFVVSAILFVAAARVYLATKNNVYQRQAVMLVKDDNSGSGGRRSNISTDALMQLNGVLAGTSVQNEVYILHSFQLACEVARQLQLDVTYGMKSGLRTISLYDERPFTINFISQFEVPARFSFTVDSPKGGTISKVVYGDPMEKSDFTAKVEWGKAVKTPFGEFVASPDEQYLAEFVGKTIIVNHTSLEDAAIMVYNQVTSAEVDKESTLVRITCTDTNIQRADDILSCMLEAYKHSIIEDKNQIAKSTSEFIEERIGLIQQELSEVEGQMADFKQASGLVDIKSTSEAILQQSSSARQRTVQAETQYSMVEYLVEYLTEHISDNSLIPTMGGISDAGITAQISNYNNLMLQRNRLAENTSPNSPTLKDMDANLSQMRGAVLASLKGYSSSMKLQVDRARAEESGLRSNLHSVPQKEKKGIDIARQQTIKETLYTYLLNKREETALQLAITEANIRVVERPFGSRQPIAPRTKVITLAALLLGIIVPFLFFRIKEMLNSTIRGRKDLEKYTTIPFLGEIPLQRKGFDKSGIVVEEDSGSIITEAFRLLRFNLPFINKDARVIFFTSTMPGEGKTFVSCNMAATLGLTGKKVILIDSDIRKRTQSRLSSMDSGFGLTSYLSGNVDDVMSLVQTKSKESNLDFLPAGVTPPNPAELLMSDRLEMLIEELKKHYDYIVVDSVPAQVVADAGIVNRVADVSIYILREDKVDRRYLPELERLYQENRFKKLCLVLNCSSSKYRKYGYGYGYAYGYGDSTKKKRRFGRK